MELNLPFLSLTPDFLRTPFFPLQLTEPEFMMDCGKCWLKWKGVKGKFILCKKDSEIPLQSEYTPSILLWIILNFFWMIGKAQES